MPVVATQALHSNSVIDSITMTAPIAIFSGHLTDIGLLSCCRDNAVAADTLRRFRQRPGGEDESVVILTPLKGEAITPFCRRAMSCGPASRFLQTRPACRLNSKRSPFVGAPVLRYRLSNTFSSDLRSTLRPLEKPFNWKWAKQTLARYFDEGVHRTCFPDYVHLIGLLRRASRGDATVRSPETYAGMVETLNNAVFVTAQPRKM